MICLVVRKYRATNYFLGIFLLQNKRPKEKNHMSIREEHHLSFFVILHLNWRTRE